MELPELPKPVEWREPTAYNMVEKREGLYTADQMRAYGERVREECAVLCDNVGRNYTRHYTVGAAECATVIRKG